MFDREIFLLYKYFKEKINMAETIAAIATGMTESGIGIIRISGPESYEIIRHIFRTKKGKEPDLKESHRVHYGFIETNVSCETLDEVLMLNMKAPHSYTGEDTVEIDCHGGILMMRRILETVLSAGARLAEPGEFTKRAFLNGRLDLSQAEAVIDVINAKNDKALRASVSQLRGSISEKIKECRAKLLEDTAYIEAALDDPEHIELGGFSVKLSEDVKKIQLELERLIHSAEDGRLIKEGIRTVIVGKPNAGKSSLLNVLVGEERAIVTNVAGTTRDTLEETINLKGVTLHIIDTAGIRETEDVVEKIGVQRALQAAETADLVIYVVDSSVQLDESDFKIIDFIASKKKKAIVLLNKSDLTSVITEEDLRKHLPLDHCLLSISAKNETGIEKLETEIERMFYHGDISSDGEICITSARQKENLIAARDSLLQLENSIETNMPEDFFTIDLMNAYTQLGYILGTEVDEDLVNEIFAKFCMGK